MEKGGRVKEEWGSRRVKVKGKRPEVLGEEGGEGGGGVNVVQEEKG